MSALSSKSTPINNGLSGEIFAAIDRSFADVFSTGKQHAPQLELQEVVDVQELPDGGAAEIHRKNS